eukprot:g3433.t1
MNKEQVLDSGKAVRERCRDGSWQNSTAGLAPGYAQGNLTVLPKHLAYDFIVYCIRNPKPCPILDISDPGNFHLPRLGEDIDIRRDLPKYVIHSGDEQKEVTDIVQYWNEDSVAIVTGCSFSFEEALTTAGIAMRHIEESITVPMFITNIQTIPSGRFHGPLVVSMRPIPKDLIKTVKDITAMFPESHGAPIHQGNPEEIGIKNIQDPDFGDPVTIKENEIPVFWACGVTAQKAAGNAKLQEWSSHAPGHMLVTDLVSTTLGARTTQRRS